MKNIDLFIFAGEASGDLHGQALINEIKSKRNDIEIAAVAGPLMRKEGALSFLPMEEFQVMGFIDVFVALPRIIRLFYKLARLILSHNPKAAVFIDYPGFNLRMEKHLRRKGYKGKIIHYISPTVWIHGKGRIQSMAKTLDQLLCILPFEPTYFARHMAPTSIMKVSYVGHPLTHRIKNHVFSSIKELEGKKVIALFPGSRRKEIERNFPLYLHLAKQWEHKQITFAVSISRKQHDLLIKKMIQDAMITNMVCIEEDRTYDLMHMAYGAIAKSGTVTLELALHSVPTCVTYAVGKVDIFIAQKLLGVDLPFYALPNILCNEKVYAELIGPYFTIENLCKESEHLLDPDEQKRQKGLCSKIIDILGDMNASRTAAEHVISATL